MNPSLDDRPSDTSGSGFLVPGKVFLVPVVRFFPDGAFGSWEGFGFVFSSQRWVAVEVRLGTLGADGRG